MKVICISGKAGSGKDTFAEMVKGELEDAGASVLITHYADELKFVCRNYFDWNGEKDVLGRRLMQHVGTDIGRAYNEDFWVSRLCQMLQIFHDQWDFVLIPDARFPNEIEYLKDNGLDVTSVRINRLNYETSLTPEQLLHQSEIALDGYHFDVFVENDGTKDGLAVKALDFTRELFGNQISFDEYLT